MGKRGPQQRRCPECGEKIPKGDRECLKHLKVELPDDPVCVSSLVAAPIPSVIARAAREIFDHQKDLYVIDPGQRILSAWKKHEDPHRHGTPYGFQFGCRCQLCVTKGRDEFNALRRARYRLKHPPVPPR